MPDNFKEKQEVTNSVELNSTNAAMLCTSCREKQEKDYMNRNGLSKTPSLSSTDSTVSSCSDISVCTNPYSRGQDEGSSDSWREDLNGIAVPLNGIHQVEKTKDSSVGNGNCTKATNGNISEINEKSDRDSFVDEMDAQVWVPPKAEDEEDDVEGSVVNYDDDDEEFGDGTKWAKSSSFSSPGEEGSGSYRFREEKEKAMDEVMNGKFKSLVGQLLNSVGVSCSGENGESWVDIVTSLSWEAASFVKPDATQGKPMDPDGYVKIKCVAAGSRDQSQVIRGLVFKKHAAHKHMPTKYKKPRLLLIRGALGLSSSGLSSFESMQQEKDNQKSIVDMVEMCHPNVVLVEKTVPRDIQESILAKGMTLVFDMKLHRLERVARCTGSPILSTEILAGQKLKHCDALFFEKFVEEHNSSGETGKKPSKTLMFIEGCPTRLGCTILLKGTHSDELKRIKCVTLCAVVMAHHLILETSFLLDQSAMFSTIPFDGTPNVSAEDGSSPSKHSDNNSNFCCLEEPRTEANSLSAAVPISDALHEEGSYNLNLDLERDSPFSYEPYNPVILSGLSSLSVSLKKAIGDSFPQFSSASPYNGGHSEALDSCDVEIKSGSDEDKADDHDNLLSNSEDQKKTNGNISTVLDSESILVLMSSRNASRGTICKQSHLSHIKFYRNFDVPLGKFLQENLLNQCLPCATCNEPPEAHFYYYAHHDKQLTIQVKRLLGDWRLPGESDGKLWMWSRCGKCKSSHKFNGYLKSTKRVLISNAARGLSFGKFLELSFSNRSSFSRLSSCGHSLQRDFLYFFGLGQMVAMMRYSHVQTYSVTLPPQKIEFNHSIKEVLLKREIDHVRSKATLLFEEVGKSLGEIVSQYSSSNLNLNGKSGSNLNLNGKLEFSDVEDMLKQERSQFEMNLENAVLKSGNAAEAVYKFLCLNRFMCDLMLESYIWDQRLHILQHLHMLRSSDCGVVNTKAIASEIQGATYVEDGVIIGGSDREVNLSEIAIADIDKGLTSNSQEASSESEVIQVKEIPIEGSDESSTAINFSDNVEKSNGDDRNLGSKLQKEASERDASNFPSLEKSDSIIRRVWASFLEFRRDYLRDLRRGLVPKLEPIFSFTIEMFPNALGLINEEGMRLHIPLDTDEYIVSDFENELSSIIACALALLKDPPTPTEFLNEEGNKDNKVALVKVNERSNSLVRISSNLSSTYWSSSGSLDSEGTRTPPSLEESRLSSFDGLNLLDSLVSSGAFHPEVSMGFNKSHGKGKYSVLCLYANQFRDLRSRCCPSEVDYIASLSRCKNWDAKGGKSKSFFAKTLDDRFIIKEIKKTEFESFTQFAPDYFRYMNECYEKGNQTCLAKILGIYQVTIRHAKSGKELKHDLMVMENLSFGRKITRQYDLKGALHARFASATDGSGEVLLDQNFVNDMNASPLYVGTKSKRLLERSVWNDTTFLNSINVMDYSLLVSVDTQGRELVCGIIDYIRQYTWDKQLETWVKSSLVVPKNTLPTIISPREYKKRFRKFMTTYFLSVPDHWCSQRSSNPCKLCGMVETE